MKLKLIIFGLFASLGALAFSFYIAEGSHSNVIGWLWGGTTEDDPGTIERATGLGWISLTSENPEKDSWGKSASACGDTNQHCFGLIVPQNDGPVTDYAWSSNVGWIDFQPDGDTGTYGACGYPTTPCVSQGKGVRRVGNTLQGWARIVSIRDAFVPDSQYPDCLTRPANRPVGNSGCWEGWIKFGTGGNYGTGVVMVPDVNIPPYTHRLDGYAWSKEFGWIMFGGLTGTPDPNPKVKLPSAPTPTPTPPATPPPTPTPPATPTPTPTPTPSQFPSPTPPTGPLSCSGSPKTAYLSTGGRVTWKVDTGTAPSYNWTFTPTPEGGVIKRNNDTEAIATYSTTGDKNASVNGTPCKLVTVKKSKWREIIPFF